MTRPIPRRTLRLSLAVAGAVEAEADGLTTRRAAAAVVAIATAALVLDEGQPLLRVAEIADQACQGGNTVAQQAVDTA
jgi:hypothetical protein